MKAYIQSQLAEALKRSGKDGVVVYRLDSQNTLEPYLQHTDQLVDFSGVVVGQMWVWASRQEACNDLYNMHLKGLGYDPETSKSKPWFNTLMDHIHREDVIGI